MRIQEIYDILDWLFLPKPPKPPRDYTRMSVNQIDILTDEEIAADQSFVERVVIPFTRLQIAFLQKYETLHADKISASSRRLYHLQKKFTLSPHMERVITNIISNLPRRMPAVKGGLAQKMASVVIIMLRNVCERYMDRNFYSSLSRRTKDPNPRYPRAVLQMIRMYHKRAQKELDWKTRQYDFDRVNRELARYTTMLQDKCGKEYSFMLRIDESLSEDDAVYGDYDEDFMQRNGVLCVMHNSRCIASIVLSIDEEDKSIATWYSATDEQYQHRGFNLLLRALSILICPIFSPLIKTIKSSAKNPITAWVMTKYFDAEQEYQSQQQYQSDQQHEDQDQKTRFMRRYIETKDYILRLTKEQLDKANEMFLMGIEKMCPIAAKKRRVG